MIEQGVDWVVVSRLSVEGRELVKEQEVLQQEYWLNTYAAAVLDMAQHIHDLLRSDKIVKEAYIAKRTAEGQTTLWRYDKTTKSLIDLANSPFYPQAGPMGLRMAEKETGQLW